MIDLNQRRQREFDDLKSVGDVINLLKEKFQTQKLFIRYSVDKTEVTINEFLDDNTLLVVTDPSYVVPEIISIYGRSDKYIEIDMEVLEERGPGYLHCRIKNARRAARGRKDLRFKVKSDEVTATNFRISKHTIDITGFNIPTSIKVVLDQFQNSNSKLSDIVRVDVFKSENLDPISKVIKKTGKNLLISNVADPASYTALNEDFVDVAELYGKDLPKFIKYNVEKGYKSIVTVPIIYIMDSSEATPFGYIRMVSKSEFFDVDQILDLKEHSFKLVDRIRDANTLLIPVRQEIVDISKGGAKLLITDEALKKSMSKSRGFIFDIVFKLQAPITIYGEIKATYRDENKSFYVGVDFEGNSSRKDEMKRFYEVLRPMEMEYKSKLIKALKSK